MFPFLSCRPDTLALNGSDMSYQQALKSRFPVEFSGGPTLISTSSVHLANWQDSVSPGLQKG